jgi:carboxyl-terminal processing protease
VLAALLTSNLIFGARLYSQEVAVSQREQAYDKIALFTKVIEQVRESYVDGEKTSYQDLIYGALRGMLQSLDPHSQFLDREGYEDMREDTAGQFGGIGVVVGVKDSVLTIIAPMEDTPGYRAGLMPGDKILEINGKSTEGLGLADAVKTLRGEPKTKVTLKILRTKTQELKTVTLEREEIKVISVKDAHLLEDGIGYLRLIQFNEKSAAELQEALDKLTGQNLKALVVDLRNNPGGLLSSAIEVSQKFLRRGDEIVSTLGRARSQQQIYKARGRQHFLDFPMAILINGGSASASEIVAGALQDHRRAILVGEKSFGKGSVQSVLPMSEGTAIRLTTAKYYTPSHRVIHDRGIEPDIVVPMSPENWRKLMMLRAQPEGIDLEMDLDLDSEGLEPDALQKVQDVQLQRAVDVLKGILTFTAKAQPEPDAGEIACKP